MFKSLRERLAGWKEKAEAEVTTEAIGDSSRRIKDDKLEEILYDLEIALLESDVAFPVAKEIVDRLAEDLRCKRISQAMGLNLIDHNAGADPAAYAFYAVEHARARGRDVVLIETAGRMQTNQYLMDQMKKIKRVAKPNLILYIGDALAGNDAIEQAKQFHDAVGLDGIVLTKIDADAKGGAALSMAKTIGKPVVFVNVGQTYKDIRRFETKWMVDRLLAEG